MVLTIIGALLVSAIWLAAAFTDVPLSVLIGANVSGWLFVALGITDA